MGYIPWQDKAVKDNYNIKWSCETGTVFGRSAKPMVGQYLYDLWGQLAPNSVRWGSGSSPSPGSFTPFNIPQDNFVPPRRLFWFARPKWFIQVFPSLNQSDLLFFMRLPQGVTRGGFINSLGEPDQNFRYPYGYIFQGKDSDIDNPTDAGEFWVPPQTDLEVAVLNTINDRVRPQCLYIMNQIPFHPYDPKTEKGRQMILSILRGNLPVSEGSVGGDNRFNIPETTFRERFGVCPVEFDGVEAFYIENGVRVSIGTI